MSTLNTKANGMYSYVVQPSCRYIDMFYVIISMDVYEVRNEAPRTPNKGYSVHDTINKKHILACVKMVV